MTKGVLEVVKSAPKEIEVIWKIPGFWSLDTFSTLYSSPNFKFLDVCWFLKIGPSETDNKDHIALHLNMENVDEITCNVLTTFSIKTVSGSIVGVSSFYHTFCELKSELIANQFFSRRKLSQCKLKLVPLNELTIVCNLKQLADPVKLIGLDTLSDQFKNLLANKDTCDVTLQVKDTEFRAHKTVLIARSSVFAAMFQHDMTEKQTGIINIPDCDPESFEDFLKYIYSGKLENLAFRHAIPLYKTADKYDVQELKMFCIIHIKCNLKVENVCDVVVFAEECCEKELHAVAQDFFNTNLRDILISAEWKTLMKSNFTLANKLLIDMSHNVKVSKLNDVKWNVPEKEIKLLRRDCSFLSVWDE